MSAESSVFLIGTREGYDTRIGTLVSQLTNTRHFLLRASRGLSVEQLDARPGPARNTIGTLLAHLNAAESMFQRITFEGRLFNEEESARFSPYFEFKGGERSHGRPLADYHAELAETRARTLAEMKRREDSWLDGPKTFQGQPSNVLYYWFHYIQDEARHTGQIILIRKHLMEGADPEFQPFTLRD
jgi:hypothetical protein